MTLYRAAVLTVACIMIAGALEIHNAAPAFWGRILNILMGAI